MRTLLRPLALLALSAAVPYARGEAQQPTDTTPSRVRRDSTARHDTLAQKLQGVRVTASKPARYAAIRITSATKTDVPLHDTPQSVTVVSRELIADQSMQSMADVVRYIPGITMALGEGHRDAPTIRGNSTTADFFVDGVRDDAQYLRDLYNVDRVEAVKGSNALLFGRGGGGGVLNRVTKAAGWGSTRLLSLEGGSFDHKRTAIDLGEGFGSRVAARVNGVYEKSGGFRDDAELRRYGVSPTLSIVATPRTLVRLGAEYFDDERRVDRGIPSWQGRPSPADIRTFFGDPDASYSTARVRAASALVSHDAFVGLTLHNTTHATHYDKFYQNVYPGAVNATGTQVSIAAYNNATRRDNLFNQSDATYTLATGALMHTLLAGVELGRQVTDNFRNTGYFGGTSATSTNAPFDDPTITAPVAFRQSATDADNHVVTRLASAYAQDQVAITRQLQAIVGVRWDRFDLTFDNHRSSQTLRRADRMVSPRAGLVLAPVRPLSLYGSYGVSFLPSSGDQFSSLTATSATLEPERFTNRELGAKWEIAPALSLDAAAYRLDRTNTAAHDPNDPSRTIQTGRQRTTGIELSATGGITDAWQIAGGFTTQKATIVDATSASPAGATVPLVPRQSLSLWNRVRLTSRVGGAVGVVRQSAMYAAIDNTVRLPAFARADGALFVTVRSDLRAQLNVENLFDRHYYATSQGNNNIMPGATRTLRVTLVAGR